MKEAAFALRVYDPLHIKYGEKLHRMEVCVQCHQDDREMTYIRIILSSKHGYPGDIFPTILPISVAF